MKKTFTPNLIFILVSLVLSALLFSACQKTSELDIPSYIAIDSIILDVTGDQGTASNKIVDAWVYTGNDLEGAFELPDTFPVLKSGESKITVMPGIKLNGMAETRVAYPFFTPITVTRTLEHENITKLENLKTGYKANTVFAWLEDFEDPNLSIDTTAKSLVKIYRAGEPSLSSIIPGEGNTYAGKVVLTDDDNYFEATSNSFFVFPAHNSDLESSVFLELNYKTNCEMTVGLFIYGSTTVQKPIVNINPSNSWNKIYINFTPTVLDNTDALKYKVYFSAEKTEGDPDGLIFLDNIKLLRF